MAVMSWRTLPFRFTTNSDFYVQLNRWLGQVFYESLPGAGFEVREEQIFTCYKIIKALQDGEILFAEAGSGTGKTFAYLLPALCHARLSGRPAVVACAGAALQEQLTRPGGDIPTLSALLGLEIKAVLAKDPENYLCSVQGDLVKHGLPKHPLRDRFSQWLETTASGDRAEAPGVDDGMWNLVAYNSSLDCLHCRRRGYCPPARARQSLWTGQDLIICSHDMFFKDLWSRRENQAREVRRLELVRTRMPYLPPYSAVVFDEGHLIENPALSRLGVRLNRQAAAGIAAIFANLALVSDELLAGLEGLERVWANLFTVIVTEAIPVNPRQSLVRLSPSLAAANEELLLAIDRVQEEMVLYQQYDVNQYMQELEGAAQGLQRLGQPESIAWWEAAKEDLWVLPRDFSRALGRELLAQKVPVIFTSATLDSGNDFAYLKRITGLARARTAKVDTSFDLEKQRQLLFPGGPATFASKAKQCAAYLRENGGRALVLCAQASEVEELYPRLEREDFPFTLLKEGEEDSSQLLVKFRREESSVLVGANLWEGIDVPGPALTLVLVFSLPFPPDEPLTLAKREAAAREGLDPRRAVDFPAMGIKLRQGLGRLIRSKEDRGRVVILGTGEDPDLAGEVARAIGMGAGN